MEKIADVSVWRRLFEIEDAALHKMAEGASVGIVPRAAVDDPPGPMLALTRAGGQLVAETRAFGGFKGLGVDVLFQAEGDSVERLHAAIIAGKGWEEMGDLVRERDLFPFVFTPRGQLPDKGLDDFLEGLGLVFMGACR